MSEQPEGLIEIALIEPEPNEAARIAKLVTEGSIPARVTNLMACENPNLDRVDMFLVGFHELGAVEKELLTRLHNDFTQTPLVVLADKDPAGWAYEAMRLGANLVLLKSDLTPSKLSSSIRYFIHYILHHKRASFATDFTTPLPPDDPSWAHKA